MDNEQRLTVHSTDICNKGILPTDNPAAMTYNNEPTMISPLFILFSSISIPQNGKYILEGIHRNEITN